MVVRGVDVHDLDFFPLEEFGQAMDVREIDERIDGLFQAEVQDRLHVALAGVLLEQIRLAFGCARARQVHDVSLPAELAAEVHDGGRRLDPVPAAEEMEDARPGRHQRDHTHLLERVSRAISAIAERSASEGSRSARRRRKRMRSVQVTSSGTEEFS